jgi:hypothetical protein
VKNLDALSQGLIRYAAWAMATTFGSAGVFMVWAGFYYHPAWRNALIYLVLAIGIERVRPKE